MMICRKGVSRVARECLYQAVMAAVGFGMYVSLGLLQGRADVGPRSQYVDSAGFLKCMRKVVGGRKDSGQ
jgi:hypothetical protein